MNIITNHHWHNFLFGYELPESVKADFDYMEEIDTDSFFIKYRGVYYNVNDFIRPEYGSAEMADWHGYSSDTFFSGVLIRLSDDGEQYQIATYIS